MFHTLLIANRGEIACRIARTARALGCRVVAVYSEADAGAAHVALADAAVPIGGASPADSYLRGDRIIAAAQATGAQAIHPGYGFLSENPEFVEAVTAAGLVFVGPSASAIRAMGLKDAAKRLMAEAGVPVVPGYHGPEQDPAFLAAQAEALGYPVLIKAVAGGGGKGMRQVARAADFATALEGARAEARGAFGNDAVLIEKFVASPRHIEVQVFGDGSRALHLFERDCSLQRRHQKVFEEAPGPCITPEERARIGKTCADAVARIKYAGAGTVEFLYEDGEFYFIEMNTRLQVEHPVTEAIFGVDLVREQIRVAEGYPLSFTQEDLTINGHAIEVRINAERLPSFTPCPGKITQYHAPGGLGVRMDSALYDGYVIPPYYDSLIGKLIVHGRDRPEALARLNRALGELIVDGVDTTVPLFHALLQEPDIHSGDYNIHWLEKWLASTLADA